MFCHIRSLLIHILILQLIFPLPVLYPAGIEGDPTNAVTVDSAQNGVPIVNMTRPSAAGVSHNKFRDYNVGTSGVILNNSTERGVSQLGGAVYANPNYEGRAADIALFEVTGPNPSHLNGYMEMFGQSAEFVLANPYGITVNGGGFINMPRVTLSTGTPQLDQEGSLLGLDVEQGNILIEGLGLNVSNVDYFDIISRTVQINAAIWANKELSLITGRNYVDYVTEEVTPKSDSSEKPVFGIDASMLGAMQAGKIMLVSTEAGVGVRMDNELVSNIGGIVITSEGDVVYKHAISEEDLMITAKGDITQTSGAFAGRNIEFNGANFHNQNGTVLSNQNITIGNISRNSGDILAAQDITLTSEGGFTNEGLIQSFGQEGSGLITLDAGDSSIDNTAGTIESTGGLRWISHTDFSSDLFGTYTVLGELSLEARRMTNTAEINAGAIHFIFDEDFHNASGKIAAKDITLSADNIHNYSEISAGYELTINADNDVYNHPGALLFANSNLTINADNRITNDHGEIFSFEGNILLQASGSEKNKEVKNNAGVINAGGDVVIQTEIFRNLQDAGRFYESGRTGSRTDTGWRGRWYTWDAWTDVYYTRSPSIPGKIFAGNNIALFADYGRNDASIISAVNNIDIVGDTFENLRSLERKYQRYWVDVWCYPGSPTCQFDFGPLGRPEQNRMHLTWNDYWNRYRLDISIKPYRSGEMPLNSTLGRVEAGNRLNIQLGLNSGTSENPNNPIGGIIGLVNEGSLTGGNIVTIQSGTIGNYGSNGTTFNTFTPTISLSQYVSSITSRLFQVNSQLGHTFLIETNPDLIDTSKLLASQYLLDRIGFDSDKDIKFLGDAFVETHLLREAAFDQLGQRYFIEGAMSDEEQRQILFDNAIRAYEDLELVPGIALTAVQIGQLKEPIVWYVEEEVMGEQVLVPMVYMSDLTREHLAHVTGGEISGDSVVLDSETDIVNQGGTISAGESLVLTAKAGDVRNEAILSSLSGRIQSGGSLMVSAGRDIINEGSYVRAGGVGVFDAGRDILVSAKQYQTTNYINGGTSELVRHVGSDIQVDSLVFQSGRSTTIEGSDITVEKDAYVNVGGNLNIVTAVNSTNSHFYREDNNGNSRTVDSVVYTHQGSNLNIGGNLVAQVGYDINMAGSVLTVNGNADIDAENINLLSVKNISRSIITTVKVEEDTESGFLSSKTTKTTETTVREIGSETHVASVINIGGTGTLTARNQIDIKAVDGRASVFGRYPDQLVLNGNVNETMLRNSRTNKVLYHHVEEEVKSGGIGAVVEETVALGQDVYDTYVKDPRKGHENLYHDLADTGDGLLRNPSQEFRQNQKLRTAGLIAAYYYGGPEGAAAYKAALAKNDGASDEESLEVGARSYARDSGGGWAAGVAVYDAHESGERSTEGYAKAGGYAWAESEGGAWGSGASYLKAKESGASEKEALRAGMYTYVASEGGATGAAVASGARARDSGASNRDILEAMILNGGKAYADSEAQQAYGNEGKLVSSTLTSTAIARYKGQGKDMETVLEAEFSDSAVDYAKKEYDRKNNPPAQPDTSDNDIKEMVLNAMYAAILVDQVGADISAVDVNNVGNKMVKVMENSYESIVSALSKADLSSLENLDLASLQKGGSGSSSGGMMKAGSGGEIIVAGAIMGLGTAVFLTEGNKRRCKNIEYNYGFGRGISGNDALFYYYNCY